MSRHVSQNCFADAGSLPVPEAVMRDASQPAERSGFVYAACGRLIVTAVEGLFSRTRAGSPQRFCDHACRQAAYRRRRAGVTEDTPPQRKGGRSRRLKPPPDPTITHPQTPQPTSQEAV
jgi:hypothetical protein